MNKHIGWIKKETFEKRNITKLLNHKLVDIFENKNYIINKLELLRNKSKKQYQKLKTEEEKEIFIQVLLYNIVYLLNNLNYIDIYNTDTILTQKNDKYKKLESLKELVFTGEKNKGGDCNAWLYIVYETIKYITNNDNFIKYEFLSKISDNHGILIIKTKHNAYKYERSGNHLIHNIQSNLFNRKVYIKDFSISDFNKTKDKVGEKTKKWVYRMGKENLRFKFILGSILVLRVYPNQKEIKHINIKGLKRISKKISYILFYTKIIGFKNKFKGKTYQEFQNILKSKLNKEQQKYFDKTFIYLNKEKIINYFELKKPA